MPMLGYQLLTILLILLLPLIPKQFADDRIRLLIILFGICLLPVFFTALLADIKRKFILTICFILFLIPLAISTIFSIDNQQSIIQLRLYLSYFVIFASSGIIFPNLRSKEIFVACYLLIVSSLSFFSLYNTLIRHYVNRENISFLWIYYGHNHLSSLLILAIPFCVYALLTYWEDKKIRLTVFVISCLLFISLLFTFSIGAMIALAVSFFIVLVIVRKTLPHKKVFIVAFLIIAFLGISSLYLFSLNKGIKTFDLRKNPYKNVSSRFVYWQKAFDNFGETPLTGSGLDTFYKVNIETRPYSRYAHNFFIQMLSDTGIFGFLTTITLIGAVLWNAYNTIKTTLDKRKRLFYLSLFVCLLSSTLLAAIDVDWHLPTVFLIFWVLAGFLKNYAK
ncbi:MAG: hypothetical protein A3B41_03740 [Candidatus Levybacteria bacterium RIFCSPLOWO2_01_FULL_37_26]|nr:MAG: hypothetical protein A3B41_03740 [Candidatus Levybacteria bacterium RIFCSPLOWO2_01_FULL_37_26]